jgi:hypothetical protein
MFHKGWIAGSAGSAGSDENDESADSVTDAETRGRLGYRVLPSFVSKLCVISGGVTGAYNHGTKLIGFLL